MLAQRAPIGLRLLAIFFSFGAVMCLLTTVALLFPGSPLEEMWRLNPEAHSAFQKVGDLSIVIMLVVGAACALAAIGLLLRAKWGRHLAIGMLAVNLAGNTVNAIARHDPRTLIGIPICGALILYLMSKRVRKFFAQAGRMQ